MIIPPLLKKGDKAIIIAPSGKIPNQGIGDGIVSLKKWGIDVEVSNHINDSDGVFAGNDEIRLNDFQKAINDSQCKLIMAARGGYGLSRYIDDLDLDLLKTNPKWIVGFSDITVFHLAALKQKIATIHGPMVTSFPRIAAGDSLEQLRQLLFHGNSQISIKLPQIRAGLVSGIAVGGNLSLICDSIGTATELNTDNKILILEDVGDYYYRMDRMLNQLYRAGKLRNIKGLVIGQFSDLINGDTKFSESIKDIIIRLTSEYSYPVAINFPIGHEPNNYPFIHGANYQLEVKNNFAILELQSII